VRVLFLVARNYDKINMNKMNNSLSESEEQMTLKYNENTFKTTIEGLNDRGVGKAAIRRENKFGKVKKEKLSVPYALPGEEVHATLIPPYRKKIARVDELITTHPDRIEPACPHFGRCGGCTWQHWSYEAQLNHKTETVRTFIKEQGFDESLVKETIPAESEWNYRNKMEFTFGTDGSLGLHELHNYRQIIPLETCLIASDETVQVTMEIADWVKRHQLSGYDKETREGLMRHLLIRHSRSTGEMMVVLFATETAHEKVPDLVERIKTSHKQVKSLVWIQNRQLSDSIQADHTEVLLGRDYIFDTLAGFRYRLWFDTFFQTNPVQAEKLVELALDMAQPKKTEKMIDLFCGVGTFSLPFAERVGQLAGIEIVDTSIQSAKRNAKDNDIDNTLFYTSDARRGLAEVVESFGTPNLFLLDPPRSGAGGKVMRRIGRAEPDRVVYVSCNPKTFATDIKQLAEFGYRLETVQPVDLFPQTYHVEVVALMSRVDG